MKSLLIRLIKKLGDMRRHLLYYRIWPAVYRRAAKKPIDEKKKCSSLQTAKRFRTTCPA